MMKNFSYRVIHPKDTEAKLRMDALNKIIDEKMKSTPELTARKDAVVQELTKEAVNE